MEVSKIIKIIRKGNEKMDISKEVNKYTDELIMLRRHFHMYPELGFQEFKTQEYIINYLENLGLNPKKMAKTGVVALLEGNSPGKTLMLRADMDALMVEEETDEDYKSKNPGTMHACGHDGHMAMMLITAKILTENKDKFSGNVKFVFQPNEEDAGAYLMVEEGVLENPKVDAAMAIHLWSPIETGMMSIQEGPVMGAMDIFRLEILGKGGHTALPQDALDPIYIASQIVINIQAIQTKEINPLTPTTISVAKLVSGTSPNIIPSKAELEGTIRYLYKGDKNSLENPLGRFERIVKGICDTYGASYNLEITPSNFVVDNDSEIANLIKKNAEELIGSENIVPYQTMAGEDFSEFTKEIPACLFFVGMKNIEKNTHYPHHHPKFNIDEDALALGVEMHVRNTLRYLNDLEEV